MTDKQQKFIAEYLKDFNATQAAIRAGYAEDSSARSGCDNLQNKEIRGIIKQHIDDSIANTKLSLQKEVIDGLKNIITDTETRTNEKIKAYELLGKYMTMFVDRKEIDIGLSSEAYGALKDLYGG